MQGKENQHLHSSVQEHHNECCQHHEKKEHKSKHKKGIYNFRQGCHTHVPLENIVLYLARFVKIMHENKHFPKLYSVENFRKDAHTNTIIRMYFQGALDQIPVSVASLDQPGKCRPGILFGMSLDAVFDLVNVVAQTPPCYSHSQFSGVPINALFIDFINTEFGKALFSLPQVNEHLRLIFNDYGNMLRSAKSLEYLNDKVTILQKGWLCQQALKQVNYDDFVCDTSLPHFGFKSWNDWFTRQLKPGARPVAGQNDSLIIVHAAENYPLTTLNLPYRNVKATDKFWLKENRFSLYDMFEAQKMGVKHIIDESFVGGTIYQGFLSPWCYHWWHAPVSGIIERSYLLPGSYFLQNPSLDLSGINNYDNSQAFLSCVSARHVFIIEADDKRIGRVAVIEIGMVEVSSCIATVNVGDHVVKGQQTGRFEFGGSSHVIVFDKKADLQFNPAIHARQDKGGFELSVRQLINTQLARVIPKQ